MEHQQTNSKRNVWEQWDWVWHISAYTFLGVNVAFGLGNTPPGSSPLLFLGLSALLALWYLPFVATPMMRWWHTPGRGVAYFLIGWALWGGLLALSDSSLLLAGTFYPLIFSRFPIRWAIGLVFVQTLALSTLYMVLYTPENGFIILMISLGLLIAATLIGVFVTALINQNVERQRLLDEFTQTRASLLKVEREAAVLAERQRLAHEIHDTLAQQFTSIIMHLSAARLGDPAALQARMQQAEQAARDGLDEARRIVWDIRPKPLEGASFVESIEGVAARWSVENTVRVAVAVTGTPFPLNASIEVALLRISQEALHNVKKHARAQNVTITLSYMPDVLALDVADDGRGFEPAPDGRGFGLKSMRERAEGLGGEFAIESEPGAGTKIAVLIPVSEVMP
ncbi:MAG: sensor histidine kinase [Anaerolineae bacterium]|nr:sensor histidine kinase [Anaerolineae bacterium]